MILEPLLGPVVVVLFMVEEGKVVRSNFLNFGVVTGFGVSPGNPIPISTRLFKTSLKVLSNRYN